MRMLITNIKLNKLEWLSLVDKGASGDAKHRPAIMLWKRDKSMPIKERIKAIFTKQETGPAPEPKEPEMTLEEILAKLPDDESRNALLALLESLKPKADPAPTEPAPIAAEAKPEEMAKRMQDEVRAVFEKAQAEKVELEKRIKEIEDRAEMVELTKRAEGLSFLPMGTVDIAKTLKDVKSSVDSKRYETFVAMLEKINKGMQESPIFKQYGSDANGGEETPLEKRDKAVAELQKVDPNLSVFQARARVYKQDPKLYAELQG